MAARALVATSGYRIPDQSAGRLAAPGDRKQVLPGDEVSADLARVDEGQQAGEYLDDDQVRVGAVNGTGQQLLEVIAATGQTV